MRWRVERRTWSRTKSCLSEACLPLAREQGPSATCLRGLCDKFPATWLCHTVCHLDNNWGQRRAGQRWHGGPLREGPLSLIGSIYSRPACSTPWLIHLKKRTGLKINKTLLTVVFTRSGLFVSINHACKVRSSLLQHDPDTKASLWGCQTESDQDKCNLQKRKHVTTFEILCIYIVGMVLMKGKQNNPLGTHLPPAPPPFSLLLPLSDCLGNLRSLSHRLSSGSAQRTWCWTDPISTHHLNPCEGSPRNANEPNE